MTTRAQVEELLDTGHTYETAGRALGIPPGRAYLIATGMPADGGETAPPEEQRTRRLLPSAQALVNPPPFNPTRKQATMDWVRERAQRELTR